MTYLDSSVLLARLFAETRCPPDDFWDTPLSSSRLLEYEVMNVVHRRNASPLQVDTARDLLRRVAQAELLPSILARATDPFPVPVRTLDALHLATAHFIRERDRSLTVATYDSRMAAAARAMGFAVMEP